MMWRFLFLSLFWTATPIWAAAVENCWEKPYFSWTFEVVENKNLITDLAQLDRIRERSQSLEWTIAGENEVNRSFYVRPKLPPGVQNRADLNLDDFQKAVILSELEEYSNSVGIRVECQVNSWRKTVPDVHDHINNPKDSDEKVAEALLVRLMGKRMVDQSGKTNPVIFIWRPSQGDAKWKVGAACMSILGESGREMTHECFHETGHVAMAWVNPDSNKVDYLSFWNGVRDSNDSSSEFQGSPGRLNSFLEDLKVKGTYPHAFNHPNMSQRGTIVEGRPATSWNLREMSKQLEQWKAAPPRFSIKNKKTYDCVRSVENFIQNGVSFEETSETFHGITAVSFIVGVQELIQLVMPAAPESWVHDTFFNRKSDIYLHPLTAVPLVCWGMTRIVTQVTGFVFSVPVAVSMGLVENHVPGFREGYLKSYNFISNLAQMGKKTPNYFMSFGLKGYKEGYPSRKSKWAGAKSIN